MAAPRAGRRRRCPPRSAPAARGWGRAAGPRNRSWEEVLGAHLAGDEVGRQREVPVQLESRFLRAPTDTGFEDALVLALTVAPEPALERERAVALAVLPGRSDQANEPVGAGRGVQGEVEGGVRSPRVTGVPALVGSDVGHEVATGRLAVRGREALGRSAHGQRL